MWVQVPPLACAAKADAAASKPAAGKAIALFSALAGLLAGCGNFGDPEPIGPADAVIARTGGPAASLSVTGDRATIAFATAAKGTQRVWAADLGSDPRTTSMQELRASDQFTDHPPLALAGADQQMTVLWLQSARYSGGRIVWSQSPRARAPFSIPRAIGQEFATTPRGGGRPATFTASLGKPSRPGAPPTQALGVWQRNPENASSFSLLGPQSQARPLGSNALGTASGEAITAALDDRGHIVLGHVSDDSRNQMVLEQKPAGPGFVWLGRVGNDSVAAWSEYRPGGDHPARVALSRSSDLGKTWTAPQALMTAPDGHHPLASFAQDGRTIAAAWRASQGNVQRIFLAVSRDAARTFSPALAVDRATPQSRPTQPAVAVSGNRVLVTWREGSRAGSQILASASADLGKSLSFQAASVSAMSQTRAVAHPRPWLVPVPGGILWESQRVTAPAPGRAPGRPDDQPLVSLTLRRLRR